MSVSLRQESQPRVRYTVWNAYKHLPLLSLKGQEKPTDLAKLCEPNSPPLQSLTLGWVCTAFEVPFGADCLALQWSRKERVLYLQANTF